MDIHYNAFISYRHHPEDIRVATEIHRALERFRVPKAVRAKNKSISRLFRDKDELPITSSLTDDITRALENSDYLIVICSVHTKESVWVQREIETFLKTHHRSRVLTVLVNGQPYEVIPEILLYEDVVDPITGEIRRVDIEPLSCDWRMKRKKAMQEELPRLAAALLGCGYDELRQRQRQYRMRRMVAGFSVALAGALCLAGYFLHTSIQIQKANDNLQAANEQIRAANVEIEAANVRIQENLDEALRNQSQYLASSAQERLEAGDRLTAIALALAALPGEGENRPYVAAAEAALSNALSSYRAEETIQAVGSFRPGVLIDTFRVTEDGKWIYIRDSRDMITVWETETFRKTGTVDFGGRYVTEIYTTPEGNMIVVTSDYEDNVSCYTPKGECLWQISFIRETALMDQGRILLAAQRDADMGTKILFLDSETGTQVREAVALQDTGLSFAGFPEAEYQNGRPMILRFSNDETNSLWLLNTEDGTQVEIFRTETAFLSLAGHIDGVCVTENGNILIMVQDGSGMYNGYYQSQQITSPSRADLYCLDGRNYELLWQGEISNSMYTSMTTVASIPQTGTVLCQRGSTFQVYEELTGVLLGECDAPAIPVTVEVGEKSTTGILRDGSSYIYRYSDNTCYAISFLNGVVTDAAVNGGIYALEELGQQVTRYRSVKDDSGETFSGDYDMTAYRDHQLWGQYLVMLKSSALSLFDMSKQELCWSREAQYSHAILGFSEDGEEIWLGNSSRNEALSYSVSGGEIRTVELPFEWNGDRTYPDSPVFLYRDALLYIVEKDGMLQMRCLNPDSGELKTWFLNRILTSNTMSYGENSVILAADDSHVWFWRDEGCVYELNTSNGTLQAVAADVPEKPACMLRNDGTMVLAAGSRILKLAPGSDARQWLSLENRKAVSLFFHREHLLVLCDDGEVYVYDMQGSLAARITVNIYDSFYLSIDTSKDSMGVSWQVTGDGDLLFNAYKAGNVIDCTVWQTRAFIPYLAAYCTETEKVITVSDGTLTAYEIYSTHRQMERGKQALNGYELTAEDKEFYGLD